MMRYPNRVLAVVYVACVAALCGLLLVPGYAQSERHTKPVTATTRKFSGEWFDVRYPAGFTVRRSLSEKEAPDQCLSAFFTSPDGAVVFYVFSPLWNGDPTDIALKPNEVLENQSEEHRDGPLQSGTTRPLYTITVRAKTARAKNNSYTRSWEDKETTLNTRRVFGFQYRNEAARLKYRFAYLAFKASLRQYSD